MADSVAEFMQKPVTRYASGFEAVKARNTLVNAFAASHKDTAERNVFNALVSAAMKTETGRETMAALSKLGYSISFEQGDFSGSCEPVDKKIVINPAYGFENALTTLIHEGTHAIQTSVQSSDAPMLQEMRSAALLKDRRAMEADAVAHETAFIYECKDVLPSVYRYAQKINRKTFQAYNAEMKKTGNPKRAMQATFVAWYQDDSFRDYYDQVFKQNFKDMAEWGKQNGYNGCFSKDLPSAEIVKKCRYHGESYVPESFLEKEKAFSLKLEDKREIANITRDYARHFGEVADYSVLSMRDRVQAAEVAPAQNRISVPFLNAARNAGR